MLRPQRTPWILRAPAMRWGGNASRQAWNIVSMNALLPMAMPSVKCRTRILTVSVQSRPSSPVPVSGESKEWQNLVPGTSSAFRKSASRRFLDQAAAARDCFHCLGNNSRIRLAG